MRPLIQGGELAYVETYKDQELEPGMVVAANGKLHMIVSMIGERIYTAGINNTRTDWRGRKKDVQFILRILVKP